MPGSTRKSGTDMVTDYDQDRVERIADGLLDEEVRGRSLFQDALARFLRNRAAVGATIALGLVGLFALIGPLFAVWDFETIDYTAIGSLSDTGVPSFETGHFFGTDGLGRDLYARTIQGTQTSLLVGIIGAVVAIVIGTLYGAVAGFVGGWVDNLMMRFVDIMISIPSILIIILLLVIFERSFFMVFVGIGIVSWLDMSRIVRGQTLALKHREFVEAARAAGVGWRMIIWRHIVPNLLGIVIVYGSLLVPSMILTESFIAFIGLGVQEPNTSLAPSSTKGRARSSTARSGSSCSRSSSSS